VLVPGPVDLRPLALAVLGPEPLVLAGGVVDDHRGSDVEDALGGAVVLLERHHPAVRVVLLEVEDVAEVGAPPAVHRLVGIAHHAEVPVLLGEELHDAVLRAVRVLVFIHEHVRPHGAVPAEGLRHRLEQPHHAEQQVVEVECARGPELLLVEPVERRETLLTRGAGGLLHLGGREHLVLAVTDAVHHRAGGERALVEVELPQRLLHQALPVVLVVDHEGGREPGLGRALSQDAHARRVEGGDERRADARGQQQILHPMAHLGGGLVGGITASTCRGSMPSTARKVGDAMGDDAGLAAPRPGQDEHGPLRGRDRSRCGGFRARGDCPRSLTGMRAWEQTIPGKRATERGVLANRTLVAADSTRRAFDGHRLGEVVG
jgi:hypothetical protein